MLYKKLEAIVALGHKRATVNMKGVGSIPTRIDATFHILISSL